MQTCKKTTNVYISGGGREETHGGKKKLCQVTVDNWSRISFGIEPHGQRLQCMTRMCMLIAYCVVLFCCKLNSVPGHMPTLLKNKQTINVNRNNFSVTV